MVAFNRYAMKVRTTIQDAGSIPAASTCLIRDRQNINEELLTPRVLDQVGGGDQVSIGLDGRIGSIRMPRALTAENLNVKGKLLSMRSKFAPVMPVREFALAA